MPILNIFTDSATSPPNGIAVGAFLSLTAQELESYSNVTPVLLLAKLMDRIIYVEYESKKSTWSEIRTVIDALYSLEKNLMVTINLYTDCKSLCDLLGNRRAKLTNNNFLNRHGQILKNADLYKELFAMTRDLQIQAIKIKGHASISKRHTIQEKIFSVVDKLCRKKLRLILNKKLAQSSSFKDGANERQ